MARVRLGSSVSELNTETKPSVSCGGPEAPPQPGSRCARSAATESITSETLLRSCHHETICLRSYSVEDSSRCLSVDTQIQVGGTGLMRAGAGTTQHLRSSRQILQRRCSERLANDLAGAFRESGHTGADQDSEGCGFGGKNTSRHRGMSEVGSGRDLCHVDLSSTGRVTL
jgi:hypothetical protein